MLSGKVFEAFQVHSNMSHHVKVLDSETGPEKQDWNLPPPLLTTTWISAKEEERKSLLLSLAISLQALSLETQRCVSWKRRNITPSSQSQATKGVGS